MVRKFDQMTRDEATRLRKDGKSVREIALLTGVALTTLKGWFKEIGLSRLPEPATRRRYTISEQQGILAEYGARKSPKVIVEKYGISKSTLFYWKKKHRVLATSKSGQRYTASEVVGMKRALTMAKRIESILGECKCMPSDSRLMRVKEVLRLQDRYSVHSLCQALKLSKATFYRVSLQLACNHRTQYEINDDNLKARIQYEFEDSGERFGAPMIQFKLKEKGVAVSREHVRRLMKEMGLVSKQFRPRCLNSTQSLKNSRYRRNRLLGKFTQDRPNVFWVSDITYARVGGSFHAICVILDLFSRKVLAYGISPENNMELVQETFMRAFDSRNRPEGLTFHSDQGVQYTAYPFQQLLRELNVRQSLSNPGTPHDNAVMEAFFSAFKREELSYNWYNSPEELEQTVKKYVDFYNQKRPHRKLKLQTPDQFEQSWFEKDVTAGN